MKIFLAILLRLVLVIIAIVISIFFFPLTFQGLLIETLKYQTPSGFFGFTLTESILSLFMVSMLWISIILGTIGKKIDYVFILSLFILSSLEYFSAENMTMLVYLGLVVATILGNVIGFGLKILRKRIWK
jgi:hypothetical protein